MQKEGGGMDRCVPGQVVRGMLSNSEDAAEDGGNDIPDYSIFGSREF